MVNKGFIIPLTKDQEDRAKLTLKELRELAKSKDISILGPKGGYLQKKPLLEKIEEVFEKEEAERLAEINAKKAIVVEHNTEIIQMKKNLWENKKKKVAKLRREQQIINENANQLEKEMQEIRILIQALENDLHQADIK